MTPKEKAIDLVDKYLDLDFEIYLEDAKHCALIAVEEVRSFHYKLFFASKGSILDKYLDNVKQEINLL